ncbi:hypothetical protein M3J09_003893 [Ascochyta lentis]
MMIGLLFLGGGMSIAHHLFYQSLHNTKTPGDFSQQLNTAYGTAFAFAAKACFIAAVGSAYTQHMWFNFRKRFVRVSTMDSIFTATSSLLSLLDPRFMWSCKTGAVIAALSWLLPLSAIVTPSTLSIRPVTSSATVELPVPVVNFSAFENFRDGDSVKASLTRLSRLVTSGVQTPPIKAFISNSSYNTEVVGPSLQCTTPSSDVIENIDAVFEGVGGSLQSGNGTIQPMAVYVAFTPFTPVTLSGRPWPIDDLGQSVTNSSYWNEFIDRCVRVSNPACSLIAPTAFGIPDNSSEGYGKTINTANALWLRFGDERLSCSVQKTLYRLRFDARHSSTALAGYSFEHQGVFNYDSGENAGLIIAIQPLLDVLRGTTYFSHNWCSLRDQQTTKCMSALSYKISQTLIHETALTAMVYEKAGEVRNKTWKIAEKMPIAAPHDSIPSADPLDVSLSRNLTFSNIIEEMSRNVTLSYFTDARYLSYNSTTAAVTTTIPINVYDYNIRNLVLAYSIAFGSSALAVLVGLYVFIMNGCTNGTASFSSILSATIQNKGLCNVVEQFRATASGQITSPSMVAGPELLQLRLRYGVLIDDERSDLENSEEGERETKRVEAFGVPGQIF